MRQPITIPVDDGLRYLRSKANGKLSDLLEVIDKPEAEDNIRFVVAEILRQNRLYKEGETQINIAFDKTTGLPTGIQVDGTPVGSLAAQRLEKAA